MRDGWGGVSGVARYRRERSQRGGKVESGDSQNVFGGSFLSLPFGLLPRRKKVKWAGNPVSDLCYDE